MLFVDWNMFGMNGIELLMWVKIFGFCGYMKSFLVMVYGCEINFDGENSKLVDVLIVKLVNFLNLLDVIVISYGIEYVCYKMNEVYYNSRLNFAG